MRLTRPLLREITTLRLRLRPNLTMIIVVHPAVSGFSGIQGPEAKHLPFHGREQMRISVKETKYEEGGQGKLKGKDVAKKRGYGT